MTKNLHIALVVSQFNEDVTRGLLKGAQGFLGERGLDVSTQAEVFWVSGAFEIPLLAKKLAHLDRFDGVICLGCVIKGETAHFEYISMAVTSGIMQVMLETGVPMAFGVLTTYSEEQAQQRSQDNPENKGREAAAACLDLICSLKKLTSV
jgi:6,7-dimethyl-8-ribityllumazine synthase